MLSKSTTTNLKVVDDIVERSEVIKTLGVWFDSELSLKRYVNEKCKVAFFNIRNIRSIRKFISDDLCMKLVQSLVLSHLDYCNSILYGLPMCELNKIQRVINCAAKLVLGKGRRDSASEALFKLHILPVIYRIEFKIATLVYKCLHDSAPCYLKELLKPATQNRSLRSSSCVREGDLEVPFTRRSTFLDRSFAVSGPKVWNSLPRHLRERSSLETFKEELKTFYMRVAFPQFSR